MSLQTIIAFFLYNHISAICFGPWPLWYADVRDARSVEMSTMSAVYVQTLPPFCGYTTDNLWTDSLCAQTLFTQAASAKMPDRQPLFGADVIEPKYIRSDCAKALSNNPIDQKWSPLCMHTVSQTRQWQSVFWYLPSFGPSAFTPELHNCFWQAKQMVLHFLFLLPVRGGIF